MLRCVIFDLDNTLVESDLDFALIKSEIGTDESILEYRETLDEAGKRRVDAILSRHERKSAAQCKLFPGARELLDFLKSRNVATGLLTRNSRESTATMLKRHDLDFDCILTREDAEPKPSPQPVLLICDNLGVKPHDTLMVGDYLYDIQSGQAAGTRTMLFDGPNRRRFEIEADYEISSLVEALQIIRKLVEKEGA